ncbi:SLAM family member 9-like isoform X4 [Equus quagga]|nr:SLAM family member 9-like isoform X4 [Equus quagga]
MLRVQKGSEGTPTWVSLQDKYMQRVHVPNMTSLRIENLTREDSGQYRARASLTGGMESNQIFDLTVYEPVPLPQILVQSVSTTAGWCNITLVCRASGVTEDLNVTWESKDLPRELEPARNSWTLAVSLPLSPPNVSLTCAVSNPKDRKTVTTFLGTLCTHGEYNMPEERHTVRAQGALGSEDSGLFSPPCLSAPPPLGHPLQESGRHILLVLFLNDSHLYASHLLPLLVGSSCPAPLPPHPSSTGNAEWPSGKNLDRVICLCRLKGLTSRDPL